MLRSQDLDSVINEITHRTGMNEAVIPIDPFFHPIIRPFVRKIGRILEKGKGNRLGTVLRTLLRNLFPGFQPFVHRIGVLFRYILFCVFFNKTVFELVFRRTEDLSGKAALFPDITGQACYICIGAGFVFDRFIAVGEHHALGADRPCEGHALARFTVHHGQIMAPSVQNHFRHAGIPAPPVILKLDPESSVDPDPALGNDIIGPAKRQIPFDVLCRVNQHGRSRAGVPVASLAGHDIADHVVLGGVGPAAGGRDGHRVDAVRGMILIIVDIAHHLAVHVLSVEQEAEIHRPSGVFVFFAGVDPGNGEVKIILRGQGAVRLHHEGIDFPQGRVGVAAEVVPLGVARNHVKEGLGKHEESPDVGCALLNAGLQIVPCIQRDGQAEAGPRSAAERTGDDDARRLLQFFAFQAVQFADRVIQRRQLALDQGRVERQPGNGAHLPRAVRHQLAVEDLIDREPLIPGVNVLFQIFTDRQGSGDLDGMDPELCLFQIPQFVGVRVKHHKAQVFPLPVIGRQFVNSPDDFQSRASEADDQRRCAHLKISFLFLANCFCNPCPAARQDYFIGKKRFLRCRIRIFPSQRNCPV